MKSKITRIVDIAGPIQKMSLKSLARALYSLDLKHVALRDGYVFSYGQWSEVNRKSFSEIEVLVSMFDIWYVVLEETKDIEEYRFLEYNLATEKTRLVKDIPDVISERDECQYFDVIHAKIYYGELAIEEAYKLGQISKPDRNHLLNVLNYEKD